MAFESLGLGGVLKFDADQAVNKMRVAEEGFHRVDHAAEGLSGHIGHLQGSMSKFSAMSLVTGLGLGVGLEQLVHKGLEANEQVAQAKMGLAIVFSAASHRSYDEMYELADQIMPRLAKVAADTMGTTEDAVRVFQKVSPGLIGLGATSNQMIAVTKGAMIMAGALKSAGLSFDDVAGSLQRMARGMMNNRDPFVGMIKSMGLLKETNQEWAALKPEDRLKRVLEISQQFGKYGDKVGESFGATWTTLQSIIMKTLRGAFGGLFESIEKTIKRLVDVGFSWSDSLNGVSETISAKLVPVWDFLVEQVITFYGHLKTAYEWLSGAIDKTRAWAGSLGIDFGKAAGTIASIATQIALIMTVAVPIIGIITSITSKIWALVQIAMTIGSALISAASFLMPFLLPIGLVVGGLALAFLAFREDGESTFDTIKRAAMMLWQYIQPIWEGLKQLGAPLMALGEGIWTFLTAVGRGLVTFFKGVIFPLISKVLEWIEPIGSWLLSTAVSWLGTIMTTLGAVFKWLGGAVDWVMGLGSTIEGFWNTIMGYIMPVATFIWDYISTVGAALGVIFGAAWGVLKAVGSWLLDQLMPIWDVLVWEVTHWFGILKSVGAWIWEQFKPMWDGIVVVAQVLGNAIEHWVVGAIRSAAGMLATLLDGFNAITSWLGVGNDNLIATAQKIHDFSEGKSNPKMADNGGASGTGDSGGMSLAQQATSTSGDNMSRMSPKDISDLKKNLKVENKLDIKLSAALNTDGRKTAGATARHKAEIGERAGFTQTPWQRQFIAITSTEQT